ncbi:winged helix-turn-helix domain-containing protein [Hyphococcus sp.]|uniref:winged helix-turn-helix domain-containing protein n=1 Tax=Hyphococcus sp. TaxID=2038636 RepID=UPI0035C6A73A
MVGRASARHFSFGGRAEVRNVREALFPNIKHMLTEGDYEPVSTGEERWWNATCWERSELVKEGLLRDDSPRGFWELSEKGISFAQEEIRK